MKTSKKTKLTSLLVATMLAALPLAMSSTAFAATVTELPSNVKEVKVDNEYVKGELSVTVPENVSSANYTVSAYEMLRLVIAKDSTWPVTGTAPDTTPAAMTNEQNTKNMYVVTDGFKNFFAAARAAYTANNSTLPTTDTLYLTYDNNSKQLNITATQPTGTVNEDYITIDNAAFVKNVHLGRIEKTFFEADLVSRIIASPDTATETTASAARLLSDWASKYVRDTALAKDAEATRTDNVFEFKDTNALIYGYYVIITTDHTGSQNTPAVNQSILNVPMATNVTLKATPITLDKSVSNLLDANKVNNNEQTKNNTDSARYTADSQKSAAGKYDAMTSNIGDVNSYVVTSHIPSYTSYDLTLAAGKGQLLAQGEQLTETNLQGKVDGKYFYVFHDTMNYQDFLPVDVTNTVYGEVKGLKFEIKNAAATAVEATYVVKNFGSAAAPEYYLVLAAANNADNAIGRLWETDYHSTDKKNFFAINLDLQKVKALGLDGRDVVITYNAELMGEALNVGADNTASIVYSNDPFDPRDLSTITHNNKLYTYDMKVDKIFSDGATTAMYDKVSFKLYSDADKTKSIQFVNNDTTNNGSYTRADSNDTTKTDVLWVNKNDGKLQLHGLGEGTYYLVEQDAENQLKNAGYNVVNPMTIVITEKDGTAPVDSTNFTLFKTFSGEDVTNCSATLDQVNLTVGKIKGTPDNAYGIELEVLNQKGFLLPLTGALGNWFIAIGGILLVAIGGTVIVLANRKKKDTKAADEK